MEPFDLHVFIDGSVIEVFTDDGKSFAARFFPQNPESNEIDAFVEGGDATFLSLDIWEMRSMNDPTLGLDFKDGRPEIPLQTFPNPFSESVEISFDHALSRKNRGQNHGFEWSCCKDISFESKISRRGFI